MSDDSAKAAFEAEIASLRETLCKMEPSITADLKIVLEERAKALDRDQEHSRATVLRTIMAGL